MITAIDNIRLKGVKLHVFHLFYSLGFLFAFITGLVLANVLQLKWWVVITLFIVSIITFLSLVKLVKQISGRENIVYYHHEIGILATSMLALFIIREPILPYLDIAIIGIGIFNIFGRCGCFFVGCCHGKPCSIGVKYNHEHVKQGFPFYFENVKLFPIQLLESIGALLLVMACIAVITAGNSTPGEVLVMYCLLYGCGRFMLEYFRGDAERWYGAGLSEAQWTTLIIVLFTTGLGYMGYVPLYNWHLAVGGLLLLLGVIRLLVYQFNASYKYLYAPHLHELAVALFFLKQRNINGVSEELGVSVYTTSLGLRVSYSFDVEAEGHSYIYAISPANGKGRITRKAAMKLAARIDVVNAHDDPYEILEDERGTYYIIYKEKNAIA